MGQAAQTRAAIADAAARLFLQHGFARTSVRDIAAESGADPALVTRYFGSKEQLFVEVMERRRDFLPDDDDTSALGERLVRYVLDADEPTRATFVALVTASGSQRVGSSLRRFHEDGFVQPLALMLTGPDADLRARLVASMVGGLMYSLWTVGDDGLAADPDTIIRRHAPLLQRLIDGTG